MRGSNWVRSIKLFLMKVGNLHWNLWNIQITWLLIRIIHCWLLWSARSLPHHSKLWECIQTVPINYKAFSVFLWSGIYQFHQYSPIFKYWFSSNGRGTNWNKMQIRNFRFLGFVLVGIWVACKLILKISIARRSTR